MSDYILLGNGRRVDPFNLKPGDFDLAATANSLSQLNRYTGHCRRPHSVAAHSVVLSWAVPPHLRRAAIIHDMPESLVNDLPRPMKRRLPEYVAFETLVQRQLFGMLDEPWENFTELEQYDLRICADEMLQLMNYTIPNVQPLGVEIPEWSHTVAALEFLDRAIELGVPLNV